MDVDASQYAAMAMEMLQRGHWLQVQFRGADYLDKPPLLFWSSALSLAVLGIHPWSYKLPSLIGAAAGIFSTWRFCLLFYSRAVARNAAFIFASSIGAVLMCNDVRTDALLVGMTACAVWQCAEFGVSGRTRHAMLTGLFIGLAMLAKGPIGAVMPAFAVATHVLLRRDWRLVMRWQWLFALAMAMLMLLPMCWGLYQQFDMHPEKMINGRTGVSGLFFFFWEQSFGRITGSSSWKNDTSVFTFLHVYLWVFLPWPLLFIGALWRRGAEMIRSRFRLPDADEGYSLGGFALTFVALSLSHYKLPHYIFVTLPWAAILVARWLATPKGRAWWIAQYLVFAVFAAVVVWLLRGVFPPGALAIRVFVLVAGGGLLVRSVRRPFPADADSIVARSVFAAVVTLTVLNFHFYPNLLPYQGTIAAARIAREAGVPAGKLAAFNRDGPALDFYSRQVVHVLRTPAEVQDSARGGDYWLYTDAPGRARLDSAGVRYSEAAAMQHFEVAQLTGTFMNASTRARALVPVYLLRVGVPK